MYQSSPSSSSAGGLPRNGSVPTRLIPARFFPSDEARDSAEEVAANTTIGLRPSSYEFSYPPALVRHTSSPAVFINQIAAAVSADKNGGFGVVGRCSPKSIGDTSTRLSFNGSESLSRISEESEHVNQQTKSDHTNAYQPRATVTHPILFPVEQRLKTHLDSVDTQSQLQFCISPSPIGNGSMDKLLNIPLNSVPCKIRAKRGCATHPRSIAERERRTRISGKLKMLQDLVPNMDKQTSYADMLDLAVQHIKTLQTQVQKLNRDVESCSCGSKRNKNL